MNIRRFSSTQPAQTEVGPTLSTAVCSQRLGPQSMATSASSLGAKEEATPAAAVTHDADDDVVAAVTTAREGSDEKQQREDVGGGHSPGGRTSSVGAKGSKEQTRYSTPEAPNADAAVSRDGLPSPPAMLKKGRRRKKKMGKKAGVVGGQSGNRSSPALNVEDLFMTIATLQVGRYTCFVS